ncbi:CEP128 [Bugula neritina]|uniref:CEP128 n=1 Tax=Bugula neritina TaxID=10212 RepID=A0A7J7KPK6_BUGNE|nr:CEP128 [Bugula neritina]
MARYSSCIMGDNSSVTSGESFSSDSDRNSLSNYLPSTSRKPPRERKRDSDVAKLGGSLKATADTLQDVDRMLGEYQSIARTQASSINKLKDKISSPRRSRHSSLSSLRSADLEFSTGKERGRRTYRPTSPLRDYNHASDGEYRSSRRRPRSAVRFRDDVRVDREHIHDIHQTVRDLSADHERLESELEREIRNRFRQSNSLENVEKRLERKLESIATKIENRQKVDSTASAPLTAATLSKSLTEALKVSQSNLAAPPPPPSQLPLDNLHLKISDIETDKRRLNNELDLLKQKHDQGEGARRALSQQVEDLRAKLREVDDERHRALRLAEEFRDSEKKSRKKQRDMEIQDLRVQLSHMISREEGEVMRRELQKTEKQRQQLTEHIETLTKDIRHKEQNSNSLLSEVSELTSAKAKLESDNSRLLTELEQVKSSLRDSTHQHQKISQELEGLQADLGASERRKDDMKSKATEVVKLWKAKCKSLQKECDELKDVNIDHANRSDQLANENDSLRNQVNSLSNQMDRLNKEMADLLTSNQDLEDKIRRQEAEFKDLRRLKSDLEHNNHEQSLRIQQMERETRKMNDQFINYEAESAQLSDKLAASKEEVEQLEQQHRQLKNANSDLLLELNKKSQALEERDAAVQDLEVKLLTTEASESALKRELESVTSQLSKQQQTYEKSNTDQLSKIERYRKELSEAKARELKTGEEYHKRFKHLQIDKDAQVESLRVDLEEAHISVQNVKRQAKNQSDEYIRLEQKYRKLEDEFQSYKSQTKRLKEQSDDLRETGEQHEQRCKEMEGALSDAKAELMKLEQLHKMLTQAVRTELSVLVETAEAGSEYKYSDNSASDILAELASTTSWLRRVMRKAHDTERQLRADMKMRLAQETAEKGELIAEIRRQHESMDELGDKHRQLVENVMSKEDEVNKLEDKLNELSIHVEEQKALDDAVEKTKILERYQRLQHAVSSLKQELRANSSAVISALDSSKDSKNSLRQRQVRISDIVTSNDGSQTTLKQLSPRSEVEGQGEDNDLQERIDAYSKALGPNSYRNVLEDDYLEEIQGTYINELPEVPPDLSRDQGYRSSVSSSANYKPKAVIEKRRHSTPRKTPATKL